METKAYTCVVCGIEFLGNPSRNCKYCSTRCKKKADNEHHIGSKQNPKKSMTPAQRLKHQSDRKVWGYNPNEYAEMQKRKTLELIGKVEV